MRVNACQCVSVRPELFALINLKNYSSGHPGHSYRGSGGFDSRGVARVGVDVMFLILYPKVNLVNLQIVNLSIDRLVCFWSALPHCPGGMLMAWLPWCAGHCTQLLAVDLVNTLAP